MSFRWRNTAFAASLLVALGACAAWLARREPPPQDPSRRFEAHQIPMDYADENVRAALGSLQHKLFHDVEPIVGSCDSTSAEVYRIKAEPGFGAETPDQATDLRISGNTARVIRKEFVFDEKAPNEAGWREVSNKIATDRSVEAIRDAAIRLLNAKVPVFDGFPPPDFGEWTIEMCWRGRYHLFLHHSIDLTRDAEFAAFAKRLTDLGQPADH